MIGIHRIPNLMFAKWDERHMIRVLFPGLATAGRPKVTLSIEEQTTFYEKGLRPAIVELCATDASEWPSTFQTELTRSRRTNGQFSYQTKQIAAWLVPDLGDAIRRHLEENQVEWGRGLLFLHNVRGTKIGSGHGVLEVSAQNALTEYIEECCLPEEKLRSGDWYIDVGRQFYHNVTDLDEGEEEGEYCLQWRTDAHSILVQSFLGLDERHASRITQLGSSSYSRDLVSHLTGVSGCRIEPGVQTQGPFQASYFQLYTTDKALTYNPEGAYRGKAFSCASAMTINDGFCDRLYEVYSQAIDLNSSHARVEVRVPFEFATQVLLNNDAELVQDSLLSFSRLSWWYACLILLYSSQLTDNFIIGVCVHTVS